MSEQQLTRQQLYDAIWTTTCTRVAQRLGITFAALVKLCERFHIPRPGNEYWPALRLGRAPTKAPLPPSPLGTPDFIAISPKQARPRASRTSNPPSTPSKPIRVADDFRRAHPLVRSTWEYFRAHANTDPQGRLEPNARFKCLDLTVTKTHARRALLLFDAIIRSCAEQGWEIYKPERTYYQRNPETIVRVGEHEVGIAIMECSTKRDPTPGEIKAAEESSLARRSFFTTNGRLRVGIGWMRFESRHLVEETPAAPLENRIAEVRDGLLRQAELQHQRKLHDEEQKRVRKEEEQIRLQSQRQQEEELERQRALELMADKWHTSERIRAFITECEKSLAPPSTQDPAWGRWSAWAREHADLIDPLKDGSVQKAITALPFVV